MEFRRTKLIPRDKAQCMCTTKISNQYYKISNDTTQPNVSRLEKKQENMPHNQEKNQPMHSESLTDDRIVHRCCGALKGD